MTLKEFRQLKSQVDRLLKRAEDEAINEGINITSPKFQDILTDAKKGLLDKKGLTMEQYKELETRIEEAEKEGGEDVSILTDARVLLLKVKRTADEADNKVKKIDEVEKATSNLSQKIKAVENKQLKESDIKQLIPKVKYYDKEIQHLSKKIDRIKIPEQEDWTDKIDSLKWQIKTDKKEVEKMVKKETEKKVKEFSKSLTPKENKSLDKKAVDKLIKDYIHKNLQIHVPYGGGGRSFQFADGETPTGTVDGSNKTFTLVYTPDPLTSLAVFVNTTRKTLTTDYTLSGLTITMTSAPRSGAIIRCDYRY